MEPLTGDLVRLRARIDADVPVLDAELHADVAIWSRATYNPWRPTPADHSTFRLTEPTAGMARFSVEMLADSELAGIAVLAEIEAQQRSASLGLFLRPTCRGRGLAVDVVRVLCHYGFTVLGRHRLHLNTLADNHAMRRTAERAGFRQDGVLREAVWVLGRFHDVVTFSLLAR